jgi:hypothetical protein
LVSTSNQMRPYCTLLELSDDTSDENCDAALLPVGACVRAWQPCRGGTRGSRQQRMHARW